MSLTSSRMDGLKEKLAAQEEQIEQQVEQEDIKALKVEKIIKKKSKKENE